MRITILSIGRPRRDWVSEGCEEYLRRLRGRLPVEVVEVRDERGVARRLPPRHLVWALDERGEQPTSAELSRRLGDVMTGGAPGIVMLIGGADGLPRALLSGADCRLSLSRLTLPHRLARLVLLEQLYRAVSILQGEPYHRE